MIIDTMEEYNYKAAQEEEFLETYYDDEPDVTPVGRYGELAVETLREVNATLYRELGCDEELYDWAVEKENYAEKRISELYKNALANRPAPAGASEIEIRQHENSMLLSIEEIVKEELMALVPVRVYEEPEGIPADEVIW